LSKVSVVTQTASKDFFRKYMPFGRALDTLKRGLFLADPLDWEDQNDVICVKRYSEISGQSVRAICVTEGTEKYHHWRSYSDSKLLVALLLRKKSFEAQCQEYSATNCQSRFEAVKYFPIRRASEIVADDLTFSKFNAYESEQEYRLVVQAANMSDIPQRLPIAADIVKGVIVNPWADDEFVEAVRIAVNAIPPFATVSVTRSTVLGKDKWIAKVNEISPKQ
jgi:hypothetical protein